MYKVLVTDNISDLGLATLIEAPEVQVVKKTGLTLDELLLEVEDADALLVRSQTQVTAEVLEKAHKLRVIGRAGVGVDNIDIEAATKRGIIVMNAPDGNTISTAEHTFAMLISLSRNIPQAYRSTVNGEWKRKEYVGVELNGKTLSIIGLGRIGAELAQKAKAFRMNIVAFDPYLTLDRAEELGVQKASFEDAIRAGDFISVHTPLTKQTRHLINSDVFHQMKDGVRILNCARGGIIDEHALVGAIQSGKVAGAALDVFEQEPPAPDHPLFVLPQVIVTPHLGASTIEAQENVAIDVAEEVLHVLKDKPFKNAVNLPSLSAELQKKIGPYLPLVEKLGKFSSQLATGAVQRMVISYGGEIADLEVSALTRALLSGVLSQHLDGINQVNAPHVAKNRGIEVLEQKASASHGFTQLITVDITTSRGNTSVAGTLLNGFGARITKVNGYSVDVVPEGHILHITHQDQPGVVGKVGTILGNDKVNIATMQVGRETIGGQAIMLLGIDKGIDDAALANLRECGVVNGVQVIEL
jgi:D-3-phosphoglycerate dehydrogenase